MSITRNNKTKLQNISGKANNFFLSKWALIIFLGMVIFLGIGNFINYGLNPSTGGIGTPWVSDGYVGVNTSSSWLGWFEITISTIGSTLSIMGVILVIRFDKRFIIPLLIGETLTVIDAIVIGYVFTGMSYILMMILAIYNYIMWDKSDDDNLDKMNLRIWFFVIFGFLAYICIAVIILYGMSNLKFDGSGYNDYYNMSSFSAWNDIISSGIVTFAWFVMLRKNRWSFIAFIITDITYLITFFMANVWATGTSYIVYLFSDTTSFISWIDKEDRIINDKIS